MLWIIDRVLLYTALICNQVQVTHLSTKTHDIDQLVNILINLTRINQPKIYPFLPYRISSVAVVYFYMRVFCDRMQLSSSFPTYKQQRPTRHDSNLIPTYLQHTTRYCLIKCNAYNNLLFSSFCNAHLNGIYKYILLSLKPRLFTTT